MSFSKSDNTIVGIDLISQGSRLSEFTYAVAVLRNGNITLYNDVRLSRVIRLLWELKPSVIAVDNIMELGGEKRNLVKVLELLPPESKIVQVTLINNELVDLRKLAIKAGVDVEYGKLTPQQTAELLAILSSKGYGTVLKLFEDKVKVVVSKGRVTGSGGSRSEKYKRSLRGAVLRAVRKIREELDKKGIDYDLTFRKSKGGIEGAVFTIYAPRQELYGTIKSVKGRDVIVRIKPVVHRRLTNLLPDVVAKRYIIVGVDPGIETGLAILDLDLKPITIMSGRNLDREEIIQHITKCGVPVLIATDKNPPPEMVEKLAASLGVKLYIPDRSLSNSEKDVLVDEYVRSYGVSIKTTHERDALASCLKAYKAFEEKFIQIANRLNEIGLPISKLQEYKAKIMRGHTLSEVLEDAIKDYISDESMEGTDIIKIARAIASEEAGKRDRELIQRIEDLIKERDRLRERVRELEREVTSLEAELFFKTLEFDKEVAKDREVSELKQRLKSLLDYTTRLEKDISSLRSYIESLKENLHKLFKGEYLMIRRINKLTAEEILKSTQDLGGLSKGEVVYVDEIRTLKEDIKKLLIDLNLKIIAPPSAPQDVIASLRDSGIIALTCSECVELSCNIVLIPKVVLNEIKSVECELMEKLRSKRMITYERLLDMINEYRKERNISTTSSNV